MKILSIALSTKSQLLLKLAGISFCPLQWEPEMRPSQLAICLPITLIMVASGCRQTTGSLAGSPLTPINPLAPNAMLTPAPSSGIGPMGGSTRVQPPGTGSIGTPNNYLGPPVSGQINAGSGSNQFAVSGNGDSVIGSGVQNAGWNGTNPSVTGTGFVSTGFNQVAANAPNTGLRPALDGMPIIDLTIAPPPPGYRPAVAIPYQAAPYSNGTHYGQPGSFSQTGSYNMQPMNPNIGNEIPGSYAGASITSNGTFAQPAAQNYVPAPQSTFRTIEPAPSNFESIDQGQRTTNGPMLAPSTEPIPRTAETNQEDLTWRRPGARF